MPKRRNTDSVVTESKPEAVDVTVEAKKIKSKIGFNPKRIAEALLILGTKLYGVTLYDYQKGAAFRIIYSLLKHDGAEITMLYARQSGKSEIIAFVSITCGVFFPVLAKLFKELDHFKRGIKMGIIAPQLDQVDTVYDRCLERLWTETTLKYMADPDIGDKPLSVRNFKLRSGSFLKAQTGNKRSKIESKTYHLVFLDEAQDIDKEKVAKSIMPMTASTFGTLVRVGTTNRQKGDFYTKILQNKKEDNKLVNRIRKIRQLHFEYNWKQVVSGKNRQFKLDGKMFHQLYEKSVNRDLKTLGENSEEFRMSYNLEWLLDEGMFITEDKIAAKLYATNRVLENEDSIDSEKHIIAGLDIASAKNSTVLTIGEMDEYCSDLGDEYERRVVSWIELGGIGYKEQFEIIAQTLLAYKVKVLFFDYTGVGRALGDFLMYYLESYMILIPYTFTTPSKSDMWKSLDNAINTKILSVPAHDSVKATLEFKRFEQQMLSLTKKWVDKTLICQKLQGEQDDYCDSIGLMNLAADYLYQEEQEIEISSFNELLGNGVHEREEYSWLN